MKALKMRKLMSLLLSVMTENNARPRKHKKKKS